MPIIEPPPVATSPRTRLRWNHDAIIGLIILVVGGAFVLGVTVGHDTAGGDVTVAPCSAWANGASPHFDGPILTDACVDEAGMLQGIPTR